MLFQQFVDGDLGCASYLVGDEEAGVAVVVDPAFAIEQYVDAATRAGVRIVRTLETHTHADHLAGHGRLALEHGVPVSIHPASEATYPFDPLADGQVLEIGAVRIRVVHTPGHRPEHCSFVVDERLALTGDSLFVGAAARPDLAIEARAGAESLFHSLRRLADLPEGVAVYPGHVAGSLCGRSMSSAPASTIGAELRSNAAFACRDLQEFVDASTGGATPRPPNMERIVELNRGPFVGAAADLPRLGEPDGATVLDVRPADAFADGHVPRALNVPVTASSFATRAAFVLAPEERIVVHAGSAEERARAVRGLRAVGFLELAGYLEDPATPARLEPVRIEDLPALVDAGAVDVIDVRELDERDHGYIPGSRHVPYRLLRRCEGADVANGRPVVTICESGARAAIAASVLAAAGVDARPVLHGGVADWRGATVSFRRCGGLNVVLVHGAGSGPWIWDGWREALAGFDVAAVDLQAGLDVGRATMADYAARIPAADAVVGWSLGGLAAMLAAQARPPGRLVVLEPSQPAELQGRDESIEPRVGTFDPAEVYGPFPPGIRARPESLRARDERKRGISVPGLPCPTLVGYGDEFRGDRGRAVAACYGADEAYFPGLDHWGLVLDARVRAAVRDYLSRSTS